MIRAALLCCLLGLVGFSDAAAGDDLHSHAGGDMHSHEAPSWEWAGNFLLEKDKTYTWISTMVDGMYGHNDETMLIGIIPTSHGTPEGITKKNDAAAVLFAMDPIIKSAGDVLQPGKLYKLVFSKASFISTFLINVDNTRPHVIFTQHVPYEFEDKYHFLKDSKGVNIEPTAEDPALESGGDKNDLSEAFLASLVSALCALVGVLTLAPKLSELICASNAAAFGSGSLLACATMLMVPKSLQMIPEGSSMSGTKSSSIFSCCVLAGFLTALLIRWVVTLINPAAARKRADAAAVPATHLENALGLEEEAGAISTKPPASTAVDNSLVAAILVGDSFQNFCNGVLIGTAFKTCGSSAAWAVAASTIFHELSQEVADFLLLTKQGGLSTAKAVCVNCLSGCACVVGTLVVYQGDPDATAVGCLLAYGAGTYIYIATVPIFSQVANLTASREMLWHLALFICGALCIGLVLIKYEDCDPNEGVGGHGHAHH
jgi:hypothetical protein